MDVDPIKLNYVIHLLKKFNKHSMQNTTSLMSIVLNYCW